MMSKKRDGFIDTLQHRSYFFDKGIRFQCTQCGICCTGEPGIVYVDKGEAKRIASYLKIPIDVLTERMIDPVKDGYTAREAEGGRCIFYENGCVIYPVRPIQCLTFPFWFQNMRSVSAWDDALLQCPGIGQGRLYTKDQIISMIQASYHVYIKALEWLYK
jgi:hypothetical protein